MASWTFIDQYGGDYPALKNSMLNYLVFSDHSNSGDSFSGTLDVAATGFVLEVLGLIVNLPKIAVSGTVTEASDTLTVELTSTDASAFLKGVAAAIPLIGGSITKAASLSIKTMTKKTDSAESAPETDEFDLNVTLAVGSSSVAIKSQVPMGEGFFSLQGTFDNVGINLDDLGFLMGELAGGNAWFPTTELGPYAQGGPSFGLLSMGLSGHVSLKPKLSINLSSISVSVGITKIPLLDEKMYMDPLGVWVTVVDPVNNAKATWGLNGSIKLCNIDNPGPGGLSDPDFIFQFGMAFPTSSNPVFSLSCELDNPSSKPVNVMLQDLLGKSTDVGLKSDLTINEFELNTTADTKTGKISDFSTSIEMSGGFGLLENFDLEEVAISIDYTGDEGAS